MSIRGFTEGVVAFINESLIPLLFTIALLVFLYGVAKYTFLSRESPEGKSQGLTIMVWGIIGLTVMVGMWGIIAILLNTFQI